MRCLTAFSRQLQSGVFSFGCQSAADVTFLLVLIQHGAGSMVKGGVQLPQPKSNILVYGGFGNTEVLRRYADGCLGFDDVHSQFTGSFSICDVMS